MTDHRSEYYRHLNEGLVFFEKVDVSGMINSVFLMKVQLDQIPLTNPETDAMVFSNFAEICSDVLGAIFEEDPQAERRLKKKINKLNEWANQCNDKALSMYPLAVCAQINKVNWAANTLQANGRSFMDTVREAGSQNSAYSRSYTFTKNLTESAVSKKRFLKEVNKLLEMFAKYFSTMRAADLYIEYGTFLVNLADFCEEAGQGDPKQILNILLEVSNNNLGFYEGVEESEQERLIDEIVNLRAIADAKLAAL